MRSGRGAGRPPGAEPVLAGLGRAVAHTLAAVQHGHARQPGPVCGLGRAVALALAAFGLVVAMPGAAIADDDPPDGEDGSVTWAVTPADADGPDGRHWIELEADPGETVTEHLAVKNLSDMAVEFGLVAADGYFTASGRYAMLNQPEESVDAGTWIDLPASVDVPAQQTALIPFTITVPANAEPGDHAAGVAASIISRGGGEEGANLGVVSRVGFRVITRVTGDLRPALAVENFNAAYDTVWHPLRPGRVSAGFDLVNTGNSRLTVTGAVRSGGGRTAFPAEGEAVIELLPGSRRHVELVVTDVWPLLRPSVMIDARPVVPEVLEGTAPAVDPISVGRRVWAAPWPQLLVLAGLALIAAGLAAGRKRSRRRVGRMIERAVAAERERLAADPPRPADPADRLPHPPPAATRPARHALAPECSLEASTQEATDDQTPEGTNNEV